MLTRHKKAVKYYFSDATAWLYGTIGIIALIAVIFAALIITEGAGNMADTVKPLGTMAIFLYALYSGREIIKLRSRSMKDLKEGNIVTKTVVVQKFGGDGRHNLGLLGTRKPLGRMKYAFVDTEGAVYYMVRGKKNLLPDTQVVGRKITVIYLENTHLVLELAFDLKDDMNSALDNFKAVFHQYFERTYD